MLDVEKATFALLVFSTSGGASSLTTTFLWYLASLLADKRDLQYNIVLGWLRARLQPTVCCHHIYPWITIYSGT